MTFFKDYLDGNYPNYDTDLFTADLVASLISTTSSRGASWDDIEALRLSPLLFDSDIKPVLEKAILGTFGRAVPIIRDEKADLWGVDFSNTDPEYEAFVNFVKPSNLICSEDEFRFIKLIHFYSKFCSR